MILTRDQLTYRKQHKIVRRYTNFFTFLFLIHIPCIELLQINSNTWYIAHLACFERLCSLIVFLIDCDKNISISGKPLLNRIIQNPVDCWCAFIKMEAMCGIEHFRSLFACLFCCQAGQHSTNRSMTMDDIILAFVNYMLQFFICLQIARFQRITLKRNIVVDITIRDYTISRILIIVPCCDRSLPALFFEHFEIWNVKLHNVRFNNSRNK